MGWQDHTANVRLLMSYVKLFIERSVYGRGMVRWSARTLLAFFLLASLKPLSRPPRNIFDSLSDQLRETAICLTLVPPWFSALLMYNGASPQPDEACVRGLGLA
jgi:hypothetical protein